MWVNKFILEHVLITICKSIYPHLECLPGKFLPIDIEKEIKFLLHPALFYTCHIVASKK